MVVITGVTGNIGRKLTDMVISRRERVRVIGRSAERLARLITRRVEGAIGDLGDHAFLQRAFTGADGVFAMIPPYYGTEDHRAYQNKIVENTARAVREAGVTHVIHLSSEGAELTAGTGPILGLRTVR